MLHLTLNSNHIRRSPRAQVGDDILRTHFYEHVRNTWEQLEALMRELRESEHRA
jgi:hypothetical protein